MKLVFGHTINLIHHEVKGNTEWQLVKERNGITSDVYISGQTLDIFLRLVRFIISGLDTKKVEFFSDTEDKISIEKEEEENGKENYFTVKIFKGKSNKNSYPYFKVCFFESELLDFYVESRVCYESVIKL